MTTPDPETARIAVEIQRQDPETDTDEALYMAEQVQATRRMRENARVAALALVAWGVLVVLLWIAFGGQP